MRIITISGKARHGKDTVGDLIKDKLEGNKKKVIVLHYGDLLKWFCKTYMGWNGKKDEKGRSILQYVGTDLVRKNHPNAWVEMIIALLKGIQTEYDYALIPDARFPNEIDAPKANFDTVALKVVRDEFDNGLTEEQKRHPSETAVDNYNFDYILHNPSNMGGLNEAVDKFIKTI